MPDESFQERQNEKLPDPVKQGDSPEPSRTSGTPNSKNWYRNAKVSVKTLNVVIVLGMAALIAVIIYLSAKGHFNVAFETDGGSGVAIQQLKYDDLVQRPSAPVKEGYRFCGWYRDAACTKAWDFETDRVTGSMTLYALWEAA